MNFIYTILCMVSLASAYIAYRIHGTILRKILWAVSFVTLFVLIML